VLREAAHDHSDGIGAFSMIIDEPVEWRAFSAWLTALKVEYADALLRVKGIVYVAGEAQPVAIHGVHHVFHPPMRLAQPQGDRRSRIVFITRGLSREVVAAHWQQNGRKATAG
jgi:G3E family GTPase